MNIAIEILLENKIGLQEIQDLCKSIDDNDSDIEFVMRYVMQNKNRRSQKNASWLLFHVGKQMPQVLRPYLNYIIDIIIHNNNDTILRNLLSVAHDLFINIGKDEGRIFMTLLDRCLYITTSDLFRPGTRCNAITLLYDICTLDNRLTAEVLSTTSKVIPNCSAGLSSRISKTTHMLKQLST